MILIPDIKAVDKAFLSIDTDRTFCKTIESIAFDFGPQFDLGFANSGNQNNYTIPAKEVC